jgi:hypothetical protein
MISLPRNPRRSFLISFWFVLSITSGLLIGITLSLLFSSQFLGLGVLLALVLVLPGLLRPELVTIPYGMWNKLVREFARVGSLFLLAICFYVIFMPFGRMRSSLRLTRRPCEESLWVPRETLPSTAYISQYDIPIKGCPRKGWIPNFLLWARQSDNSWAYCLLPFLILLRFLETEEDKSFPKNIYTLY